MNLAVEHHGAGRLAQANAIYQQVLDAEPGHAVALNLSGVIALQQNHPQAAVDLIKKALEAAPVYAEAHSNLGLALTQLGDLDEAVSCHRRALEIEPQSADALCNLGNALTELERYDDAAANYRQALALEPQSADIHYNLANTLQTAGRLDDSIENYKEALRFQSNHAPAHFNLGSAYLKDGQVEEAITSYRASLSLQPDNAEAHSNLGKALAKAEKFADAIASFQRALELKPDHTEAMDGLGRVFVSLGKSGQLMHDHRNALGIDDSRPVCNLVLSRSLAQLVPRWHVPMMNDGQRNDAYFTALSRAVSADTHVLEIGTGSGLLAMMAAREGVRHVTTCEAVPLLAETARNIVADNGLATNVTVIAKRSTELTIKQDMMTKADLLVSEVLSSEFISEGVLSSIEDAKRRLLKPGAQIIPAGGSMMIALFGGEAIGQNVHVKEVYGFDLSRFNAITAKKHAFHRNDLDIELLSQEVAAFEFDFMANDHFPSERKALRIPISQSGLCHGIIQWNRLQMDAETTFENHPQIANPASAWNHAVYAFAEPVNVEQGQLAIVSAAHDRNIPWFALEELESGTPAPSGESVRP